MDNHQAANSASGPQAAGAQAKSLIDESSALAGHALDVKHTWEDRLADAARERPYLTLTAATTAGFVLGGGMAVLIRRRIWLLGARLAMSYALQQLSQSSTVHDYLRNAAKGRNNG